MRHAIVFLALFIPYSYFNHSEGWNQGVRLAELHAVVLKHTLRIDDYIGYTGDRALIDGHYYSEKAPAMALAALPSFAVTVWIQQALGIDPDDRAARRWSEWISTALSIGVLAALGGTAFFALLDARLGALAATIATFGVFLGSITWPYAASLFAHAGTIGLLAIALWGTLGGQRRDVLAGLAAGVAVASEYPAIIPGAAIGLYLATLDLRRMWRYGLATLPAAALILLNNYAISGSPFKLSYGSNPLFPELTNTSYGFNAPDFSAIPALLFSEYRGLLFWNPIFLMAVPGLYFLWRADRRVAIAALSAIVLVFIQVASFYTWFGGNAIGPRYLSPALPLVGLASAYGIKRFPEMGLLLGVLSIGLMAMVLAVAIDPPGDVLTPLRSYYLPRIDQGRFVDNLGTLFGLPLLVSMLVPLACPALAAWRILKVPR